MGNFNRGRSGRNGGFRPRFNDRGSSRGPVEMHQAVCDNCGKNCEVPFRPTSGKPIFCSSCFEGNRGSDSRPTNFEEKRMFEATCDECKNSCKVPFQPSGGKPVYCSNCFGEKKGAGSKENAQFQPQYTEQFEQLNNKLDKILIMLSPEIKDQQPEEQTVDAGEETKAIRKKSSKLH
ncbi:MAG: hypothetical protein PHE48_02840 [Candidatus Daviesbacteria bacterium]|nr:hypothetical protein [Candidatus Daviesbacteria bacterium]